MTLAMGDGRPARTWPTLGGVPLLGIVSLDLGPGVEVRLLGSPASLRALADAATAAAVDAGG
jgi:hypothetical protein